MAKYLEAEDAVNLPEEKLSPWFGPEIKIDSRTLHKVLRMHLEE